METKNIHGVDVNFFLPIEEVEVGAMEQIVATASHPFNAAMVGTYSKITEGMLDESPMAYKSIDTVIDRQTDCIEVVNKLMPILTLKGGGRDEG